MRLRQAGIEHDGRLDWMYQDVGGRRQRPGCEKFWSWYACCSTPFTRVVTSIPHFLLLSTKLRLSTGLCFINIWNILHQILSRTFISSRFVSPKRHIHLFCSDSHQRQDKLAHVTTKWFPARGERSVWLHFQSPQLVIQLQICNQVKDYDSNRRKFLLLCESCDTRIWKWCAEGTGGALQQKGRKKGRDRSRMNKMLRRGVRCWWWRWWLSTANPCLHWHDPLQRIQAINEQKRIEKIRRKRRKVGS